jgi:hypothetical protein
MVPPPAGKRRRPGHCSRETRRGATRPSDALASAQTSLDDGRAPMAGARAGSRRQGAPADLKRSAFVRRLRIGRPGEQLPERFCCLGGKLRRSGIPRPDGHLAVLAGCLVGLHRLAAIRALFHRSCPPETLNAGQRASRGKRLSECDNSSASRRPRQAFSSGRRLSHLFFFPP